MALKKVMTGNMALLKFNGTTIGAGIVNNVDFNDDLGLQDIDGIGQAESAELVYGAAKYTISMSKFFVVGKTLVALGYQPNSNSYLTSGALEIELLSNVDGTTQEHYTGVKLASGGRSYGKHAASTENASFRALHKVK